MKKAAILLGFLSVSSPAIAVETARDLMNACRSVDIEPAGTPAEVAAVAQCLAFIQGFSAGSTLAPVMAGTACVPDRAAVDKLRRIFLAEMILHPENADKAAGAAYGASLTKAFPCPAK